MPRMKTNSQAVELDARHNDAIRDLDAAPLPGARDLPVLRGLRPDGKFGEPQDNVLIRFAEHLTDSQRVFRYGSGIVFESRIDGADAGLIRLAEGPDVLHGAEAHLANLLVCEAGGRLFPLPRWFVQIALRAEIVKAELPLIGVYAHRPVYDAGFVLRGPGWHPAQHILVHGPNVDPIAWPEAPRAASVKERLPRHLGSLLDGFCFRSDIDRVNAMSLFVTGLLLHRYVDGGKPVALIDGNQPGVGKTLLARTIGLILDGRETGLIRYTTDDEELQKRICAGLKGSDGSLVVLDNAKMAAGGELNSPTLECLTTAPKIALRVLGTSTTFSRPNDLLWLVTMNDTRASRDLITRGVPVRLAYDGDPGQRQFDGSDPTRYARQHRIEILGELAGMIARWTLAGRPRGTRRHRYREWADEVGGIMQACGLHEFLANLDEAAEEFTSGADEIVQLAEFVAKNKGPMSATTAVTPTEWATILVRAGIRQDELREARTPQAKSVRAGNLLKPYVGRPVTITMDGREGTATLRLVGGRARYRAYYFDVAWGEPTTTPNEPTALPQHKAVGRDPITVPSEVVADPQRDHDSGGNNEAW